MEIIKPRALKAGDTVGLIAPASSATQDKMKKAIQVLESLGLEVKVGKTCTANYGYLSGKDELRAGELNEMFADPQIAGIICLRGGYGTPRILDMLDYEMIRKNPKIFVGFSDITALHTVFQNNAGLVTFHGLMGTSIINDAAQYSLDFWKRMLFGEFEPCVLENPPNEKLEVVQTGYAKGRLCGGNLSLIADTLGTPYEIDTKGKILFIEEVEEPPYQIDRMLTNLRLAGKLDEAVGIVLGDFADCTTKNPDESLTLETVLQELLPKKVPILKNLRMGHCDPQMSLPFHVEYEMDGDKGTFRLLEKPVI